MYDERWAIHGNKIEEITKLYKNYLGGKDGMITTVKY